MKRIFAVIVSFALIFPARAEQPVIALAAIPIVLSEGTAPLTANSLTEDVAVAARGRPGLRALSSEELFVSARAEVIDEVRGCGADEACMSERLSTVDAGLGVVVLVSFVADPPLVAIRLVDTAEKKVVASAIGPVEAAEGTISGAVRARVARILEARGYVAVREDSSRLIAPVVLEEPSVLESPWLWIAVGVAAVVGTVVIVGVSSDRQGCICTGPPESCEKC